MTIKKRKELKLRSKYPELKKVSAKTIENWVEGRRDLGLCGLCPVKGLCCYTSIRIEMPNKKLCVNKCTEHLRRNCTFDKKKLPRKCKKSYNIILSKQPCKFLNLDTMICNEFENRFYVNRTCQTIKNAPKKEYLGLPADCVYLKGRKKKKYMKYMPKIYYGEVKGKLCNYGRLTFELMNISPHKIVKKY